MYIAVSLKCVDVSLSFLKEKKKTKTIYCQKRLGFIVIGLNRLVYILNRLLWFELRTF